MKLVGSEVSAFCRMRQGEPQIECVLIATKVLSSEGLRIMEMTNVYLVTRSTTMIKDLNNAASLSEG